MKKIYSMVDRHLTTIDMKAVEMRRKTTIGWLASVTLIMDLFFGFSSQAQGLQDSLKQDDSDIVSSIAPYPADVREAILDVSQYPQKLVKIERLQARTSQSFQDMVATYPRDVQEKLYDLARYPDLVSQLATEGTKSPADVKTLLAPYPQELAATVNDLYPSHEKDIQSMDKTYRDSQDAMQSTIKSLPDQTQADFKKVISMPDVMNILTDRIDLTVSLGEAFKNNPDEVRQSLNSLNGQITTQNAKDLDDYKQKVATDPQLQQEMKQSSTEFANDYSDTYDGNPQIVNNYYSTNPYPYWYGYPYWYSTPVWYPRPLYYHTGFYYGAGGNMVVVGLPSYAYSNWFFNYGYRRYPRMYGRYGTYYNMHSNYRTNINIYRGYNNASREHFNRANGIGGRGNYNGGNTNGNYGAGGGRSNSVPSNNGAVNRARSNSYQAPANGGRSQYFRNSGTSNGTINNQRMNSFNSQQFHQQSWQGIRGGNSGMRSGGGGGSFQRSSGGIGGAGRSGGGGFGGGGARSGGGGGGSHSRR